MSYEMMRAGLSCAFFIESRDVRRFDSHNNRKNLWNGDKPRGNKDQTDMMNQDLWRPLSEFVDRLKNTEYGKTQTSLFDHTNIVITSEFGRFDPRRRWWNPEEEDLRGKRNRRKLVDKILAPTGALRPVPFSEAMSRAIPNTGGSVNPPCWQSRSCPTAAWTPTTAC